MSNLSSPFESIVTARRSLRAFLPTAVDNTTLERVFATAQHAPSNCNTQPWLTHVASGDTLTKLRELLPARFMEGNIHLDFPYEGKYDGVYKDRQYSAAMNLYDSVGITREDKAARHQQFMRNFTFFDAPHVAFLFLPEPFGLREAADVGMYAQTLMLALTAEGLGSCPQTALAFHANSIREVLSVPEDHKLLFGISFGHPDTEAAINRCTTDRAELKETVMFHT